MASLSVRIKPVEGMEIPPSYSAVRDHLDQVIRDPSTPLDVLAIEKLQAEITATADLRLPTALITQISLLLPILREDPSPLAKLAIKAAANFTFAQIHSIEPSVDFLAGLQAPSPPINLLALSLLGKASQTSSDAAVIAGNPGLVASLLELWLSTADTTVAQAAFDVLSSLLEVDYSQQLHTMTSDNNNGQNETGGQGLMWRRIFGDKNIYSLFFSICSLSNAGQPGQLGKREKTVAQGRMMDFVIKVGSLNWLAVTNSHFPEIEASYQSTCLLSFAACHMVDIGDTLMHMTLINFLCELLPLGAPGTRKLPRQLSEVSYPAFSSPALEFLVASKLHDKTVNYYLDASLLDSATATYISGPVMAYISQYALLYPNHLLRAPQSFLDKLLSRISQSFSIPSAQWAHGPVPSGDLNILASLPRVMLLEAGVRSLNPLLSIPAKPLNKDTLNTLGRVFHGPLISDESQSEGEHTSDQNLTSPRAEAAAARVLYLLYLNRHPDIWSNVVVAAETLAMQDIALAAISFIKAVLKANWEVVSSDETSARLTSLRFRVPTEAEVSRLGPATHGTLPTSGLWALLVPPALTVVLPYLFKRPQTYANFVAGGANDTESAVWRVTTAKFDVLVALQAAARGANGREMAEFSDLVRTIDRRVADGPWGSPNQVGSRVDVLEL